MGNKIRGYYVNDKYSFTIKVDSKGRKFGKLLNQETGEVICDDMYQRVYPEKVSNLLNVAKVIISAAWQDGEIQQEERTAFEKAFETVSFTKEQRKELEQEFVKPSCVEELLPLIVTREEKLLVLETSLLLIMADKVFHAKEKEFIERLVTVFELDSSDFALLYYILPEEVKKYIVSEKIHETLAIREDEIATLSKYAQKSDKKTEEKDANYDVIYTHLVNNWKNRSSRYHKRSIY